jgi:hypothetical protein
MPRKPSLNPRVTWFVEPFGEYTNKVVNDQLGADADVCRCEHVWCHDARFHDLWKCTWDQVRSLIYSRRDAELKFVIWKKVSNGVPTKWRVPQNFWAKMRLKAKIKSKTT